MLKRIFWGAVICALLAGAYVQETGKDIPYVSPAVRSVLGKYAGLVGAKAPKQEKKSGPAGVQKHASVEVRATEAAPRQETFAAGSQVSESGTVIRILSDDNKGSRHQRFIVQLVSGKTLLIAHNIDLALRIEGLCTGDTVSFCGEYEPNAKGGVIHWTHRDPAGRHPAGWIRHNGRTYQ